MTKTIPFALSMVIGLAAALIVSVYAHYRRRITKAGKRLRAGSTVVKTGLGDIEYAVEGEGPPVLSLHGAGGGYHQGLWVARMVLGDGHKFIAVSRYGYLRTPLPASASIKTQAAQYRDLLDTLRIPKVAVLGTSGGGPSAMQFANDYPERTTALILLSAVSRFEKPTFSIGLIQLIQQSDYAYWLVTKLLRPVLLNLLGIPAGVYAKLTPAQKRLAQEMLDTMHPMSQRYLGTVKDGEMLQRESPSTERVQAPSLVLHAKDDALVSYSHAVHAHEAIPHSQLRSFDTGGHGLISQMDNVRQEVKEFLR